VVALATAFVRLRPQPDRTEFRKQGEKMGAEAGSAAGKSFGDGFARDASGKFKASTAKLAGDAKAAMGAGGQAAGSAYADGFYRDASGKLRQANGRFATDAQKRMLEAGGASGKGFGESFTREGGGTIRGFQSLKADLGPLLVPAGVGAAVLAIGKIGIEYENNLNTLKAVTNATGAEMAKVSEKARQLGADVNLPGVSAAGAAKAMTELSKAGFTVQQSMDAAKGTLQLARIAAIDEGEAAEIAANAVNAFGLKATEVNGVVDQLAATANSSSVEIKEVSYSFKQAAAVFSGVQGPAIGAHESITELNTAIGILGNNGIKGSDAGTSLKQMLLQLTGPSEQAKDQMAFLALNASNANISLEQQNQVLHGSKKVRGEALAQIEKMNPGLKDMGDIAYDSNGKMRGLREIIDLVAKGTANMTQEEKNYAVTQIFGADASRAVLALLKGGLPVYDQMRAKVLQQGSAAKVAAAQNAGLGGAIDNVKGQFENAAIAIYEQVKGPLTSGLNSLARILSPLAGGISRFGQFIRENGETIKTWAIAIGIVTAALKINSAMLAITAAGGLVQYAKSIKIVTGTTRAWAAAQTLLNATLLANPIGLAIVAIAAIGAALFVAYKKSETFRNIVQSVWGAIKKAIGATVDWFVNTAWPSLKRAYDQAATAVQWFYNNVIKPVWSSIQTVIRVAVTAISRFIDDLRTVFRGVSAVVTWLYQNIFRPVFAAISKVVEIWWLAMRVAFAAFVKILQAAVMPVLRSAQSLFVTVFRVIVAAVKAWWADMKTLFGLFRQYVVGPIMTALRVMRDAFRAIFTAIATTVRNWWQANVSPILANVRRGWQTLSDSFRNVYNSQVKPLFERFGNFMKNNVAGAFKTAVGIIKTAWEGVKAAARTPVAFVVNKVINPFIGGLNKAASVVGVKDRIEPIKGFENGGQIPGARPPGGRDNHFARVRQTGKLFAIGSKEFVTNSKSTEANLPLMQAINGKRGKVSHADVDPFLDGNDGHGRGDGLGDFFGKIVNGLKGVGSAVLDPGKTLRKMADSLFAKIPGAGILRDVVSGAARKVINGAIKWITDFGIGGIGGAGVSGGGWRGMQRLISQRFPGLKMISGFRPGARTLSGNRSYHALGRAVDYPAVRQLAAWIKSTFGKKTKELITPWQDLNLHNGKPHTYTGAVWNQHNFAGGNAHVHWAARDGGLVTGKTGMPIKLFDQGGWWPSGTLGVNMSGRTEYVDPNRDGTAGGVHIHIERGAFEGAIVSSPRDMENLVVAGMQSAQRNRRLNLPKGSIRG
jgi:phage-related protein